LELAARPQPMYRTSVQHPTPKGHVNAKLNSRSKRYLQKVDRAVVEYVRNSGSNTVNADRKPTVEQERKQASLAAIRSTGWRY
jgi:hypothetical protein